MGGEEADALQAFHAVDLAEQAGEIGAIGDVFAVAVHDLPQQSDLFDALADEGAHFGDDVAHRTAAFDPALIGDDAKGAGVGAAQHNGHMGRNELFLLRFG